MIPLAIAGLVVGIVFGTHFPWWAEVIAVIGLGVILEKSNLEMAALIFVPGLFMFAIGCIIGDINWAFQSGAIAVNLDVPNPFAIGNGNE
jgi:hypothetical protein